MHGAAFLDNNPGSSNYRNCDKRCDLRIGAELHPLKLPEWIDGTLRAVCSRASDEKEWCIITAKLICMNFVFVDLQTQTHSHACCVCRSTNTNSYA